MRSSSISPSAEARGRVYMKMFFFNFLENLDENFHLLENFNEKVRKNIDIFKRIIISSYTSYTLQNNKKVQKNLNSPSSKGFVI